MIKYPVQQLADGIRAVGGKVFTRGDYNLNIVGVRSADTDQSADLFNDTMCIFYKQGKVWKAHYYKITTDPGKKELADPSFPAAQARGTLILAHGHQYRGAYELGFHGGGAWRHAALRQVLPVKGYRDNNRDYVLDMIPGTLEAGYYGANIHAAQLWGETAHVGRYSAGCQVFAIAAEHQEAVALWYAAARIWGTRFTYSLLHENAI